MALQERALVSFVSEFVPLCHGKVARFLKKCSFWVNWCRVAPTQINRKILTFVYWASSILFVVIKTERCEELVVALSALSCHDTILREEAISIYDVGVRVVFYMDLYVRVVLRRRWQMSSQSTSLQSLLEKRKRSLKSIDLKVCNFRFLKSSFISCTLISIILFFKNHLVQMIFERCVYLISK